MVDSISGYSSTQALQAVKRAEQAAKQREEKISEAGQGLDTVSISSEAIDLAAAQQATQSVKTALQENEDLTLGLDPSFDARV